MKKNISLLTTYLKNDLSRLIQILILSIIVSTESLLIFYLIKQLIDNLEKFNEVKIVFFGIVILGIIVAYWFMNNLLLKRKGRLSSRLRSGMRKDFFMIMQDMSYKDFAKNNATDFSTNILQDIDTLVDLVNGLLNAVSQSAFFVITLGILYHISFGLTTFLILIFCGIFVMIFIVKNYQIKKFTGLARARTSLNSSIKDITDGQSVLKQYNAQNFFIQRLKIANKQYNKEAAAVNLFGPTVASTIILGTMATYVVIFFTGPIWLKNNGLTYGEVFLFLTYMPKLWEKFKVLTEIQRTIMNLNVYMNRVFKILKKRDDFKEAVSEIKSETGQITYKKLEAKKVYFSYEKNKNVIKGLSFEASAPSLVCVVGASGAGKSTLFDLLLRLYEIDSGQILIDGINIQDIPVHILREKVGIIHQNPILINDSVINNILLGNQCISKEYVVEVAKNWNLHKYIIQMEQGYNTNVGHMGEALSVGQRRIVSILRILCKEPEIFLIDEITSNVDSHSEIIVRDIVSKLAKIKLCLLITHKTEDLKMADQIIKLK